jgi:ADP-heptose:LPS heptosyltransferase
VKVLVIRFSSLGDIIYTTPVVRSLKQQLPDAEIHFITKEAFAYLYSRNPYVDKLIVLQESLQKTIRLLRKEQYDCIIDLHNNLRSGLIKLQLPVRSYTYPKQRLLKWLSLKLRKSLVPREHLVDRYFRAVRQLGVTNDQKPIDYFFSPQKPLSSLLPNEFPKKYVAFVIGAAHFTKRMPNPKVISICDQLGLPVVLLGGKDVAANAMEIEKGSKALLYNACGKTSLDESVQLLSGAYAVIGFDTGLTHIAEAFNKPIASIWGSTVPELLGVEPYQVTRSLVTGVELPCRPCSKFGLSRCPEGHFKCMWDIPEDPIIQFINHSN